jgi:hypothetical protein
LAQNNYCADKDDEQIEILGGLQKGCIISPTSDEIVIHGMADEDEMRKVKHPWQHEKTRVDSGHYFLTIRPRPK